MQVSQTQKIFFTDVDDTLVTTDKKLTNENRRAILRFLEEGNVLAISTGRALAGALNLLRSLGLLGLPRTYISAFNGSQIYDTGSRKTLFRCGLSREQVRVINRYAHEFGIHIHAYDDTGVLTETDNENVRRYCSRQNLPFRVVPDLADAASVPTCKLLAIDFSSPERVNAFRQLLADRVSDSADVFLSNEWLLEIVPKGINKGRALRYLADALSVPIENTISAGDEENDLPMIEAAGIGCAMQNAIPKLKDAADYVTEQDNNHSGVAEILAKFG